MISLLSWAASFLTNMKYSCIGEISLDNYFLAKFDPYGFLDNDKRKYPLVVFDHEKEEFTTEIAFEYDQEPKTAVDIIQLAVKLKPNRRGISFNGLRHDSIIQIQTIDCEDNVFILQEWGITGVLYKLVIEGDAIYGKYEYNTDTDCLVLKETTNAFTLPKSIGSREKEIMGGEIIRIINPRQKALEILLQANLDRIIIALTKKGFIQTDFI